MQRWNSKREMMGDDPPYLAVGTEVSAKYKGAFCEAKVRKIVRSVKCKVAYKLGLGTGTVTDDQIKGTLRAGATVEVRHSEKKEYVEAVITKIQDCSQYTVVFDDGDITTLRRTALCLKSGRHFAESETLDQLPLTHPEHFGNPVIGGRRGRRNRQDDSSDDEETVRKGKRHKEEKEADIGKVVCVEVSEKKKQKDNWFPGLVVAPTAQDTVRIHVREDYLVRSFKDGRYYTVPKKEATPFTREIGLKVDNNTLRIAVDKALLFLDKDELPPHWDRELLFGLDESSGSDSDAPFDSDTSDDEPREEKDHFVAQLYKFMDDRGTPINKGPIISTRDVDLYKLFKVVHKLGGYNRVTNHNQWKTVSHKLGFGQNGTTVNLVKHAYKKFLHSFEDFYRKLGCTMVNHPRGQRSRHRSNRSLIRDKDRTSNVVKEKPVEKEPEEIKDVLPVEIKKEEVIKEEEKKIKEIVPETPKAPKDSRKEIQRTRTAREEKVEKKEEKIIPTTSKTVESVPVKLKEEKNKIDDREERIKMRDLLKLDVNVMKEETKQDVQYIKNVKLDDNQKTLKTTRREVKKEDKEEEIRLKKPLLTSASTANSISEAEEKNSSEGLSDTSKKSRSIFSRLSVNKKSKATAGKIPRTSNKQIGINKVKKTQTFKERMKAIVKRFKIKKTVKVEKDLSLSQTQPPLLSPSEEISEDDKKKKPLLSSEEEKKKKAVFCLEEEKKKKIICHIDRDEEMKKKKIVSTSEKDEEKKKKPTSEEQEKVMPQLTRSKSKEEGLCVLKTRKVESVLQENRAEKKPGPPQPVGPTTPPSDADKKRGRKRKDTEREDKSNGSEEILDLLPSYKTVSVGDKLKVYYGPTHESKVTYEAKVLNQKDEGNEQMYLVHYTGWNTRYDEWIKRSRIADNLSWNPGRAKRIRQPQQSLSRNGSKRGRRSESGGGGGRPTTPSSVTSSSSRTKSPAVSYSTLRSTRNKTRPRRISGHTDLSESESDEEYNSESDNESLIHTKLRNRIGSEVGDEDELRKTDTDELCKEDNEIKHNLEILEDRTKGMNSSDEKDKEENQESVFSRMRSRSYRRKYDEKLQDLSTTDKQENDDNTKDDFTESLVGTETRGKKIKEEVEDTIPDELPRDRTRSRSEKRKAEEINKLQPLHVDEIKKELVVDEPIKNDRLRSRNDKRKVLDSKSEIDNENERDNSLKDVENERECSDTSKHNKTEENEEDITDPTNDTIITKKKSRGKSEESVNLIKDASNMKEEHEDENQTKERRRSRRVTPRKDELVRSGTKEDEDQPKGRDFDLNQIRSELKGIDKTVKLPLDMPQHAKKESEPENKSTNQAEYKNKEELDVSIKTLNATADDIYEFKEPEPFEFEVRKCSDEKGLKQMRTFGRICEDTVKKSELPVRRKIIRSKTENSPPTTDIKRRYRRNVKKDEVEIEDDVTEDLDNSVSPRVHESNTSIPDNRNTDKVLERVTPTKVVKEPCEEAFDKLVETPSFREVLTSVKVDDILQPLFELPGESDTVGIDEDSEGRLVISETETETEPEGPLFSHQQRDHEDLFPTLMSQKSPSNESLKNSSGVFSGFPNATEIKEDEELNKKDDDEDEEEEQEENEQDEEEEECSITAAIQRVISQHTTDEESSDTDILQGSQISIHKEAIKNEEETIPNKIFAVDSESEMSLEHNEEEDKQNIDEDDDDDDDNDLSIPLKIVEDEENSNSPIVESIILNDSLECDSKLTINECNETEDDDNDDNEENIENEDEEVIQENDENSSSDNNEEIENKEENEKEEENLIEIDVAKAEVEETLIEEFEECSQQSEKGDDEDDDEDEETVISEVMELSNDKALILETAVIEDVVLEEVKEELILEEECEDVEEQQEEEVQIDEEEEEKGESKEEEKENTEEVVEIKDEKVNIVKEEAEETESNFQSLLCEETIPGSPAPPTSSLVESENAGSGVTCVAELPFASAPGSSLPHYKPPAPPPPPPLPPPPPPPALPPVQPALPINNEAAPVMDNTPPTTPESSLSPISNSPRGERSGSSPVPDNDSSKSHRDSSEVDMDMYQEATKIGNYSEEDTVCVSSTRIKKPTPSIDDGDSQSSKKRRRSHRQSEDNTKRPKLSHRSPRHHGGSESDDTSENSLDLLSSHSRSPRPSKYNFYVQLDPELDGSQRIAVLQQKLAELRKTYMSVKTELACIDRRRKKLRRREREEKSLKPELSCS